MSMLKIAHHRSGRVTTIGNGRGPGVRDSRRYTGMGALRVPGLGAAQLPGESFEDYVDRVNAENDAAQDAAYQRERDEAADELERLKIVAPIAGTLVNTIIKEGAGFARQQFGGSVSDEQFAQAARLAAILGRDSRPSFLESPVFLALLAVGGIVLLTSRGRR